MLGVVSACGSRSDAGHNEGSAAAAGRAGPGSASAGTTTAVSPASLPPPPQARDADHQFLRRLADHYEAFRVIAHDRMSSPAGHAEHGAGSEPALDPGDVDLELDNQQRAVVALLDTLYDESYSPRSHLAGAGHTAPAAPAAEDFPRRVAAASQAGVRLLANSMPSLRRPAVRALARAHLERQRALAVKAATTAAAPGAKAH